MKVLYIGCYRDGSGWARAALDYINAIRTTDVDLCIRPLKLNGFPGELSEELRELEVKPSAGIDVVIQHVLPHFMEYQPGVKNIGLFVTETDSAPMTNWVRKLNMMDELWVPNTEGVEWCKNNGVKKPVKVIPHAADIKKYTLPRKKLDLPLDGKFTFYFIGEHTRRKNIAALLKAFHLEFTYNEPVNLLLKVNKFGSDPYDELAQMCEVNKMGLRLYKDTHKYHQEIIIADYMSDDDILDLHHTCDCFIMPSFGEAWNIPAFDAMAFGKTPICTKTGGMKDFIKDGGFLIDGQIEPVCGVEPVVPHLSIGYENWCNISVNNLRNVMRFVYQFSDHDMVEALRLKGKNDAYQYSYEKIGQMIKDTLYEQSP